MSGQTETRRADVVFHLPGCTLRVPWYVPSVSRRYSCPVEGGRYLLKWDKAGRLVSLVFHEKRKPQLEKKTCPSPVRAPRAEARRGRLERRNRAFYEEQERKIMEEIVKNTIEILRRSRHRLTESRG